MLGRWCCSDTARVGSVPCAAYSLAAASAAVGCFHESTSKPKPCGSEGSAEG